MTDKPLTKTQVEILDAVLEKNDPYMRRDTLRNGGVFWYRTRYMGGASMRAVETLRERGYLTSRDKEFGVFQNELTAKGARALQAHLRSPRRYKPTDPRLAKLVEVIPQLEAKEAAIEQNRQSARAEARRIADENSAKALAKHIAKLRAVLDQYGIDAAMIGNGSDDDLLEFARAVEGAEY